MDMNTFTNICQGKIFEIPENQRGFSWRKRHVEELFRDLLLAGESSHYMGPIIVSDSGHHFTDDSSTTTARFTLEDGQQRVTTLMVVVNELRKRIINVNSGDTVDSRELERLAFYQKGGKKLRLENRNQSLNEHFSFVMQGSPLRPERLSPPMQALEEVASVVEQRFRELEMPDLIKWKNRVLNQAKYILVDLKREGINRYLAFDAINSRGLALSEFDKIKNFCILIDQKCDLSTHPEDNWYKAISQLGKFGVSSRTQEDAFIAELYSVFHDEPVSQSDVHRKFVDRYRCLLEGDSNQLLLQFSEFIGFWEQYAEAFGFLSTSQRTANYGQMCTAESGKWLDRLDNMDLATITRTVLATSWMTLGDTDFEKVARACEIFTFRVFGVRRFRKDKHSTAIIKLANSILRNGRSVEQVLSTLCDWLRELAPLQAVVDALADGNAKYNFDSTERGWQQCYYFLYEYEIYCSPHGVSPLPWGSTKEVKVNTQEHILPQRHRDGGWWEKHWPDAHTAEKFKHRLGNLVLTTGNSVLGRKEFALKLNDTSASYYFDHHTATNSEKRITQFSDGTTWRPANVLRRERDMLEFAVKRWSIPCCTDNGLIALPDEFVDLQEAALNVNEVETFGSDTSNHDDELDDALDID